MSLQTETPLWMPQAVVNRSAGVALKRGAIHRLEEELLEVEAGELLRHCAWLRVYQLQFIAG